MKSTKNSDSGQSYLDISSGIMIGLTQAVVTVTSSNEHSEKIKGVPLEVPPYSSTDESCAATSYTRGDVDLLKSYFKKISIRNFLLVYMMVQKSLFWMP